VFDNASERAQIAVPDGSTDGRFTLTFPAIPSGSAGTTYARFRLSTDAAAQNPTGAASDGEVEDHQVTIADSAPTANADFDGDSDVDGADFLAWQRGFGTAAPNATPADGDADGDLDVDGDDLTVWESQFGGPAPLAAVSAYGTDTARLCLKLRCRANCRAEVRRLRPEFAAIHSSKTKPSTAPLAAVADTDAGTSGGDFSRAGRQRIGGDKVASQDRQPFASQSIAVSAAAAVLRGSAAQPLPLLWSSTRPARLAATADEALAVSTFSTTEKVFERYLPRERLATKPQRGGEKLASAVRKVGHAGPGELRFHQKGLSAELGSWEDTVDALFARSVDGLAE